MTRECSHHDTETPTAGTSTPAQRRAIVLAGRARGLDVDTLRSFTPAGSLRALSFVEASAMLDLLNSGYRNLGKSAPVSSGDRGAQGGREPTPARGSSSRSQPGVLKLATPPQRETLDTIRQRLGWSVEHMDAFSRRTIGVPVSDIARRQDASKLIAVLGKVMGHATKKASRSIEAAMAAGGAQ